jgi:hypothetical protein
VETPSLFTPFVRALRQHWKTRLPTLQELDRDLGPALPKDTSFLAGPTFTGLTLYINLQPSSKPWQVGEFTVNLLLAGPEGSFPDTSAQVRDFKYPPAGVYRIGIVLYRKDKWWHLAETDGSPLRLSWRATSYGDLDSVREEAVEDVTADVRRILDLMGVGATGS